MQILLGVPGHRVANPLENLNLLNCRSCHERYHHHHPRHHRRHRRRPPRRRAHRCHALPPGPRPRDKFGQEGGEGGHHSSDPPEGGQRCPHRVLREGLPRGAGRYRKVGRRTLLARNRTGMGRGRVLRPRLVRSLLLGDVLISPLL